LRPSPRGANFQVVENSRQLHCDYNGSPGRNAPYQDARSSFTNVPRGRQTTECCELMRSDCAIIARLDANRLVAGESSRTFWNFLRFSIHCRLWISRPWESYPGEWFSRDQYKLLAEVLTPPSPLRLNHRKSLHIGLT